MSAGSTRAKVNHPVNTRVLHKFLESKQEFAHWIKGRINQYGFVEGVDFVSFDNFIKAGNVNKTLKEYDLTIPMAKVLSMVERTEKGSSPVLIYINTNNNRPNRAPPEMARSVVKQPEFFF